MSSDAKSPDPNPTGETSALRQAGGGDFISQALTFLRNRLSEDRIAPGTPSITWQETRLGEWAKSVGLLLSASDLLPHLRRGGQEHDIFHDANRDRIVKVTRHGVFGFFPGIELALVSSGDDARRFHLWDATPIEYLERLHLQNLLIPGINQLEGVIIQGEDVAIVSSQPRFELVAVTEAEIDVWFATMVSKRLPNRDIIGRKTISPFSTPTQKTWFASAMI